MADSEISRTLPAITCRKVDPQDRFLEDLPYVIDRRNLLPTAARLLSALLADPGGLRTESGPTPVKKMWPRWYACHQQRVRATRLREKLEAEILEETGGAPVAKVQVGGKKPPVTAQSFADINQLASQADQRLGYSAAVAREQELAEQAGISGRVMWITRPSSFIEVTAKLHCFIVMHDPGLKLDDAPWPELRTLLKDLIRIAETRKKKACASSE